jgi:hypothetical protein
MPRVAKRAQWAMFATAAIALVLTILSLVTQQGWLSIIGTVLLVGVALFFGRGQSWTRLIFTFLAVLSLYGGVISIMGMLALKAKDPAKLESFGLGGVLFGVTLVLTVLQLLAYLVSLFFLWQRPVTAWFEETKTAAGRGA